MSFPFRESKTSTKCCVFDFVESLLVCQHVLTCTGTPTNYFKNRFVSFCLTIHTALSERF